MSTYLESLPDGYPRLAALLGRRSELRIFRRFSTVRMRLLLLKQDQITKLESELNTLDETEVNPMFLGTIRGDLNEARRAKLIELDEALAKYDDHLERTGRLCGDIQPQPVEGDIESLEAWYGRGSIARAETKYLNFTDGRYWGRDLLTLEDAPDIGMKRLGQWQGRMILRACRWFGFRPSNDLTTDQTVFFISDRYLRAGARAIVASLTIILLLVPVILLNYVQQKDYIQQTVIQFVIIFLAATMFVTAITMASKARMVEIFVAGATYTAVLVVFVASNGNSPPTPGP
ncbi:hypothetical protein MMC30_006581 [Trapelia coarctata]|nr:hypothetical protein [Trapelia coarctata]